jgi:RecA/RadA recombinase
MNNHEIKPANAAEFSRLTFRRYVEDDVEWVYVFGAPSTGKTTWIKDAVAADAKAGITSGHIHYTGQNTAPEINNLKNAGATRIYFETLRPERAQASVE